MIKGNDVEDKSQEIQPQKQKNERIWNHNKPGNKIFLSIFQCLDLVYHLNIYMLGPYSGFYKPMLVKIYIFSLFCFQNSNKAPPYWVERS